MSNFGEPTKEALWRFVSTVLLPPKPLSPWPHRAADSDRGWPQTPPGSKPVGAAFVVEFGANPPTPSFSAYFVAMCGQNVDFLFRVASSDKNAKNG